MEGSAEVILATAEDSQPVAMRSRNVTYLGGWLDEAALGAVLAAALQEAGPAPTPMPGGLRRRQAGATEFLINYDAEPRDWDGVTVPGAGVVWRQGGLRDEVADGPGALCELWD